MELLAYANVLGKQKIKGKNYYWVKQINILEYIALRERNALIFLVLYIEKTLHDSGLWPFFHTFLQSPSSKTYTDVRNTFFDFTLMYTKISKLLECGRIFTKVLNPLAYSHNTRGTKGGDLSADLITYDMLMYNRPNFRDIYADKPKGVTRKEYAATHPIEINEDYYRYQSNKATRFLRIFNDQTRNGQTEHLEPAHPLDKATHMHHIFPKSLYPEISFYLENIIALTPTQHLNYAHPNGRTQEINEQYQHLLLLSKADRIRENLSSANVEHIYEFSNLLFVLSTGFEEDTPLSIADMDFCSVVNAINRHYA